MSRISAHAAADKVVDLFRRTRWHSINLVEGLEPEDMTVQSMPDASPAKWHLAHTSWFFEEFILRHCMPGYRSPDERFAHLFNSYYVQAGPRFNRAQRGLVTRPTVRDVMAYREAVDEAMEELLARGDAPLDLVELGCHHEMQHQELLLTDIKHAFSHNPLCPAYRAPEPVPALEAPLLGWTGFEGGIRRVGHEGGGFAYDNEGPRHDTLIHPFRLANRAVTTAEWLEFMADGGYETPTLWLADGWATVEREGWTAPLYWWREEDEWQHFTLRGRQPLDLHSPVHHISYYEADAFARWAGKRLPTEAEWEVAAHATRVEGNFVETGRLRPAPARGEDMTQLWGDVWEWTQSAYLPYPGFRPPEGAVGEYNGKFMVNQFVLRGGSCLTPVRQIRPTYRNFFYPHHRWQMTGLRLAEDAS